MLIILFALCQFFSFFNPQALAVSEIYNNFNSSHSPQEQKQLYYQILNKASGLDKSLTKQEWNLYLKINTSFASANKHQDFIQSVENVLNNTKPSLKAAIGLNQKTTFFDILVYGDELPGIAAAITASRIYAKPLRIALIRPNSAQEPLGGLITRGGLAYLDRNQLNDSLPASSEFYKEFLERAQVHKIALDPALSNKVLKQMLAEAHIEVISGTELEPIIEENKIKILQVKGTERQIKANIYIDASPNADLARKAGLKYNIGFESLGLKKVTLPISPIFQTKNLNAAELQTIEKSIFQSPQLMQKIKNKIKTDIPDQAYADWLLESLNKQMFIGEDCIDIRSIALGAAYHLYYNKVYNLKSGFLFDRANIAILKNGNLSWNGFLYKVSPQEILLNGSKPNAEMIAELKNFEFRK